MAGFGPPPKPADKRARGNKDPVATTVLRFVPGEQPKLPPRMPDGEKWPERTRQWWALWGVDPRADHFDAAAWDSLLDTAVIHGAFWSGELKWGPELRLRVAAYGVTPADRARLRITFAEADGADDGKGSAASPAKERYGDLRVLPSTGAASE